MDCILQYCQIFWRSLIPVWIKVGLGKSNETDLSVVTQNLKRLGWEDGELATAERHGAILHLIAAMIACVAYCCHNEDSFKQAAEQYLSEVETALPKTTTAVQSLRKTIQNPGESSVHEALGALPFYYH